MNVTTSKTIKVEAASDGTFYVVENGKRVHRWPSLEAAQRRATAMILFDVRTLTAALREQRGTLVGIACKAGNFSVTETRKEGRKSVTEHLTGWQSHAECVDHLRAMAA